MTDMKQDAGDIMKPEIIHHHQLPPDHEPFWGEDRFFCPFEPFALGDNTPDRTKLVCLSDYTVGGSHYWTLQCPECQRVYYYDTYSFALSPKPDIVAYAVENGVTRISDFAYLSPTGDDLPYKEAVHHG